jgi:hypothetical protein
MRNATKIGARCPTFLPGCWWIVRMPMLMITLKPGEATSSRHRPPKSAASCPDERQAHLLRRSSTLAEQARNTTALGLSAALRRKMLNSDEPDAFYAPAPCRLHPGNCWIRFGY